MILRQKAIVIVCLLVCIGLAATYSWLATPVYEAATTLRIDPKQGNVPEMFRSMATGSDIATELEVLRSRALVEDIVDTLGLRVAVESQGAPRAEVIASARVAADVDSATFDVIRTSKGTLVVRGSGVAPAGVPVELGKPTKLPGVSVVFAPDAATHAPFSLVVLPVGAAVAGIQDALAAERQGNDANVVTVSFRSTDPRLARDLLNTLADRFITRRQESLRREAKTSSEFLKGQLAQINKELDVAERSLLAFRQSQRVVDPRAQGEAEVSREAAFQAERSGIEAERQALAALLSEVESQAAQQPPDAASAYRRLIAFPTLLRNQAASELLRSLTAVEDQRAALLTRRLPADPDVQVLSSRVRDLERDLATIASTYLQGLEKQVESHDDALAQFGRRLSEIPGKELRFAQLQRAPKVLEELGALVRTRLKEAEIALAAEDQSVQVLDRAVMPVAPVRPRRTLNLALGVVVGISLGGALALLRERMDRTVRTRADVQWATGLPVVGLIPRMKTGTRRFAKHPIIRRIGAGPPTETGVLAAEAFHRLDATLAFMQPDMVARTILLTSPNSGDGKTTSAANLAIAMAQRGCRVALVDADLRRGFIHSTFGLLRSPGLSNCLQRSCTVRDALHSVDLGDGAHRFSILTTGTLPARPSELLAAPRLREVIEQLHREHDVVLLDSPPVNVVADASHLAGVADGVLVVARVGHTPVDALQLCANQLATTRAPLCGAVLTDIDLERGTAYDSAYKYLGQSDPYYVGSTS